MYIIELFVKLKNDFKQGNFKKKPKEAIEVPEKCSHLFVPIDSTGRILACSKCGAILKRKTKQTNPFKN